MFFFVVLVNECNLLGKHFVLVPLPMNILITRANSAEATYYVMKGIEELRFGKV